MKLCVFILVSLGFVAVVHSKSIAAQEENDDLIGLENADVDENDVNENDRIVLGGEHGLPPAWLRRRYAGPARIVLGGNGHGIPPAWLRRGYAGRSRVVLGRNGHGIPPAWLRRGVAHRPIRN